MIGFFKKQIRQLSDWWSFGGSRKDRQTGRIKRPRYVVRYVDDVPEGPESGYVYLVGEGSHLWFAVLRCPCGCGDAVQVPLVKGRGPQWTATADARGAVTLRPSIWRRVGCHSHFIVQGGQILWAGDTGQPPPQSFESA